MAQREDGNSARHNTLGNTIVVLMPTRKMKTIEFGSRIPEDLKSESSVLSPESVHRHGFALQSFVLLLTSRFLLLICYLPIPISRFSLLDSCSRPSLLVFASRFALRGDRGSRFFLDRRLPEKAESRRCTRHPSLIIRLRPSLDPSESSQ